MNDDRDAQRRDDPRIPDETYADDVPVRERNTSPPDATAARGTGGGSMRILLLVAAAIIVVAIVLLLSGAIDLGGDSNQGTDLGDPIPAVVTPGTAP